MFIKLPEHSLNDYFHSCENDYKLLFSVYIDFLVFSEFSLFNVMKLSSII